MPETEYVHHPDGTMLQYGPWCPTSYLRYNNGKLEQRMRRRVKVHVPRSHVYKRYEFEWHAIPEVSP